MKASIKQGTKSLSPTVLEELKICQQPVDLGSGPFLYQTLGWDPALANTLIADFVREPETEDRAEDLHPAKPMEKHEMNKYFRTLSVVLAFTQQ